MSNQMPPLYQLMNKLRLRLHSVLDELNSKKTAQSNLKALILVMCEQLTSLTPTNKSILLALALRPDDNVSPLAHHMFCCALVILKLGENRRYHTQYLHELMSAALTMRIGLDLNEQHLSDAIFARKKLTSSQQKHYYAYPLHSANYLHKAAVVNKNSVYGILQHQELLNGSGYPKRLKSHQISASGKILALVNKFVELVTPRAQRNALSLSQAFSYLTRRDDLYCRATLTQLVECVDLPAPGMSINLPNKTIGIIESVDHLSKEMTLVTYCIIENKLVQTGAQYQQQYDEKTQLQICPLSINDQLLHRCLLAYPIEQQPDHCNSSGRLKPTPNVIQLLESLDCTDPDKSMIEAQINALPHLGQTLIDTLSKQYPNSKFNSSFHAVKMAGFNQIRPLLAILALRSQLSYYQFPALNTLNIKLDSLIATCQLVSDFTPHVLPNQLAMFAMLNVAPLYFDTRVHQTLMPEKVSLSELSPTDAASLFGLQTNKKQAQIINTLARFWESSKNTKQLLAIECDLSKTNNRYHHELMLGYQLSLLITHHIFHQVALNAPTIVAQVENITRKLKISEKALQQIIQSTLDKAPFCELTPT